MNAHKLSHQRFASLKLAHFALPVMLVLLIVVFAMMSDRFLTLDNMMNVARQSVYLLLVTFGQMLVLLNAQLDLSVGATIALSSVGTALVLREMTDAGPESILVGLAVGLLVGLLAGVFNGVVVGVLGAPAFMATLGSASVFTAIALILTNGTPISGLPKSFTATLGSGRLLGIPVPILIAILVCVLIYFFLTWTVSGRNMFAVGGNADAARVAGISVTRSIVLAFVLCSLLAGLTGALLSARVGSGEASLGSTYVLMTIAAAVLGGTNLFGGDAAVRHVILGVLFISVLSNGMNLIRVSSYIQELILGVVLIAAVASNAGKILSALRNRFRRRERAMMLS